MFTAVVTPRFYETDAFGHINNTVITGWFETAREPIFRIFSPQMDARGMNLILARVEVDYVAQTHYGHEVELRTGIERIGKTNSKFDRAKLTSFDQMSEIADRGDKQIADARPAGRFTGEEPEPRAGLRGGHMPGAFSVPASEILSPDGTVKSAEQLKDIFEKAGVDLTRPIITTCGSGVTAAVLSLALERIGHKNHALYDGSWAEWGMYEDLAVEKG